jgi:hypothetical protein
MHTRIEANGLIAGLKVHYKYDLTSLYGPFKVMKTFRDHEGAKVLLRDSNGNDRSIALADDEDYGSLSFYTETT